MPSPYDHLSSAQLLELLQREQSNLFILLQQAGMQGPANVSLTVTNQIQQTNDHIARIREQLLDKGGSFKEILSIDSKITPQYFIDEQAKLIDLYDRRALRILDLFHDTDTSEKRINHFITLFQKLHAEHIALLANFRLVEAHEVLEAIHTLIRSVEDEEARGSKGFIQALLPRHKRSRFPKELRHGRVVYAMKKPRGTYATREKMTVRPHLILLKKAKGSMNPRRPMRDENE